MFMTLLFTKISPDLLPDGQEGKTKEESQTASKLGNQGGERVEKHLFFNLGFVRGGPECYKGWAWCDFGAAPNKPEFLITTWGPTSSLSFYAVNIFIDKWTIDLFKFSEVLILFASDPVLVTPLIPGKSTSNCFRKLLLDANCEVVCFIFHTWSPIEVELFVLCQGEVMVDSWLCQRVSINKPKFAREAIEEVLMCENMLWLIRSGLNVIFIFRGGPNLDA